MALHSWIQLQPPLRSRWQRRCFEQELVEHFGLDQAIEDEIIRGYHFLWDQHGQLKKIRLVPHDKVRRTPGIAQIKRLFFHIHSTPPRLSQRPKRPQ